MINRTDHYVEYALLVTGLDDAREHLETLVNAMTETGSISEDDFAAHLGHSYAHLNRAWHARNQTSELTDEQFVAFSEFPRDLKPIG